MIGHCIRIYIGRRCTTAGIASCSCEKHSWLAFKCMSRLCFFRSLSPAVIKTVCNLAWGSTFESQLRIGTPEELLALARDVASPVFVMEPELLMQGFQQDVPWGQDMQVQTNDTKTRLAWRRYEGGAAKSTCRFVVVFPPSVPLAEMDPPFVVLDGLNSASNVGQVLRTAYHLGINSVVASPAAWGCLNGRACRVSMGWMYRMKFHAARPLSKAIRELQDLGNCIYVAENQFSEPVAPHEPLGDKSWALVIGSEGLGVSDEIVQMCDRRVSVPQQQGHSLNVAHACSICLYELSKSSWAARRIDSTGQNKGVIFCRSPMAAQRVALVRRCTGWSAHVTQVPGPCSREWRQPQMEKLQTSDAAVILLSRQADPEAPLRLSTFASGSGEQEAEVSCSWSLIQVPQLLVRWAALQQLLEMRRLLGTLVMAGFRILSFPGNVVLRCRGRCF